MSIAHCVLIAANLAAAALSFGAWRTARKARRATEQKINRYEFRRLLADEVRRSTMTARASRPR